MGPNRRRGRPTRRPLVLGTDAAVEGGPGDGLFELRFNLGPTARRITYRFTKDGRIILLTTFRKQRNN
jgi:putative component of toxin-antitoxin plasmid stabilization module